MKLPELKKRFNNKYVIRIVAGVLMVGMLGTSFSAYTVYAEKGAEEETTDATDEDSMEEAEEAEEDSLADLLGDGISVSEKEIGKEETVYVISDNKGNAQQTIVSDHLINNDDKDTLEDASTLTDIENVKGDETFTQNGTKLTWQADGNDIYYQGTSNEETPVTQKITYYLDGKEVEPEELAGKSGKVTVRFDYTNNEKVGDVYVPFAAISGLILDDSFSDIQVTNGKVVSDGNNNIVVGYALPGLKESLELKDGDLEDAEIPDYFEFTADVEDFELDMTMTIVVNAGNYVGTDGELDLSNLDELLDSLSDATEQLEDGSAALAEGLDTLQSSMSEFSDGVSKLQSGIKSYTDGAATVANGIATLQENSGSLVSGVSTLNSSAKSICAGISTLDTALNTKLTAEEQAAYEATASKLAVAAVDAQMADDTNPMSYNNIKNTAATTFYNTVASEENIASVASQLETGISSVMATDTDVQTLQSVLTLGFKSYIVSQISSGTLGADAQTAFNNLVTAGYTSEQAADAILQNTQGVTLDQYAQSLTNSSMSSLVSNISSTAANQVVKGVAEQAKDSVGTSVADSVKTAAETAASTAASTAVVTGIEETKSNIASQIEAVQENGYSLVTGTVALAEGTQKLEDSIPALTEGISLLKNGSETLVSNNTTLVDGVASLANGTTKIVDGVEQLDEGSHTLADGIVQFNEEGIEKIVNAYNGDVKDLVERLQEVLDAGETYQSYTEVADGVNGSVKFIYKTAAVKVEE